MSILAFIVLAFLFFAAHIFFNGYLYYFLNFFFNFFLKFVLGMHFWAVLPLFGTAVAIFALFLMFKETVRVLFAVIPITTFFFKWFWRNRNRLRVRSFRVHKITLAFELLPTLRTVFTIFFLSILLLFFRTFYMYFIAVLSSILAVYSFRTD